MHNRTSKQRKAALRRRAHYPDEEIKRRLARADWEAARSARQAAAPPKRPPPPPKPAAGRIPKRKVEVKRKPPVAAVIAACLMLGDVDLGKIN